MTKDVLIAISGIQVMGEEDSDVEMIMRGDYYQRNGKHYILYDKVMEGFRDGVKNMIRISPVGVDIIKRGIANAHMQFEKNKKNLSCCTTPLGDMVMGIQTNKIKIKEQPDNLKMDINYSLDISHRHLSDYSIRLDAQSCVGSYTQISVN